MEIAINLHLNTFFVYIEPRCQASSFEMFFFFKFQGKDPGNEVGRDLEVVVNCFLHFLNYTLTDK